MKNDVARNFQRSILTYIYVLIISMLCMQGGQIFSDSTKPFAKIFIFEDDISIFWHKK